MVSTPDLLRIATEPRLVEQAGGPARLVSIIPDIRPNGVLIRVLAADGSQIRGQGDAAWDLRDGDPWSVVARWAARGAL